MPITDNWKDSSTITGSDIYVAVGDVVIGTGTGLVLDVTRDKRPAYTFGSVDPRAIGRGVRQITGMMNAVNIKTSVVFEIMSQTNETISMLVEKDEVEEGSTEKLSRGFQDYKLDGSWQPREYGGHWLSADVKPILLDELPPVNLVLIGMNEAGLSTKMAVNGVEFTSVQWAITMDDVASAERVSFIARSYQPLALTDGEDYGPDYL